MLERKKGKRVARGWGQASLLSPTRAIVFSLPNVFRALHLFDNSFFIFGIPLAASAEERKSGQDDFFQDPKKQTNKQMLQGREGYHADMMNISPFWTWSVFPYQGPGGKCKAPVRRHLYLASQNQISAVSYQQNLQHKSNDGGDDGSDDGDDTSFGDVLRSSFYCRLTLCKNSTVTKITLSTHKKGT